MMIIAIGVMATTEPDPEAIASDGSRHHHGRDLQIATGNLVDERMKEYPGQGLAKVDDELYCQPFEKFINHKKTMVKRHLGMLYISIFHFTFVSSMFFSCVIGLKKHQMPIKHDLLGIYKIMVRAAKYSSNCPFGC